MAGKFPVKEISNWSEFQKIVAGPEFRNWAFRGQRDADWPLFSSLSRHLRNFSVDPRAWAEQEERMGRIFRRKAHLFLDHVPDEEDAFQWLALMQHHGAPTRLLDFTWSPFVAAFFALELATEDAAVWAVFVPSVWREEYAFPQREEALRQVDVSLHRPGAYSEFYLGNKVPFVSSGEPQIMNRRLTAQSGTFITPGVLDIPVEAILSRYAKPEYTIIKFVLKTRNLRDEAMVSLYNMNITNATLFPDLDGLARSMAYELEFHWAYNPKTMEVNPGYDN